MTELVSKYKYQLIKWMSQSTKRMKWLANMTTICDKCLVDNMANRSYEKLTKWPNDEMTKWWNDQMMKWPNDEMT